MEIAEYKSIAHSAAWLLIIIPALGKLDGFLGSNFQIPIDQASTRILALQASQIEMGGACLSQRSAAGCSYTPLLTSCSGLEEVSALVEFRRRTSQVLMGLKKVILVNRNAWTEQIIGAKIMKVETRIATVRAETENAFADVGQ